MRAYSEDLRKRIVDAVSNGQRPDEVAELFAVSPVSVRRLVKQRRERGHLRAALPPGRMRQSVQVPRPQHPQAASAEDQAAFQKNARDAERAASDPT